MKELLYVNQSCKAINSLQRSYSCSSVLQMPKIGAFLGLSSTMQFNKQPSPLGSFMNSQFIPVWIRITLFQMFSWFIIAILNLPNLSDTRKRGPLILRQFHCLESQSYLAITTNLMVRCIFSTVFKSLSLLSTLKFISVTYQLAFCIIKIYYYNPQSINIISNTIPTHLITTTTIITVGVGSGIQNQQNYIK